MSRKSKRVIPFSKSEIDGLPIPASSRVEWWDESTPSLSLRITERGVKSFYWVGRTGGEWKRTLIGHWPKVNVSGARIEAKRLSGEASQGKPVIARSRRRKGEWTLGELYDWYLEEYSKKQKRSWKKDTQQWEIRLKKWASRPVSKITTPEIQKLHTDAGAEYGIYAANSTLKLLRHMYHLGRKLKREHIDCDNPAADVDLFPTEERERFLDDAELPLFIKAVQNLRQENSRDFAMLCIWTGARRHNVCAMRFDEISFTSNVWTVPKRKSKNKREMRIQLIPLAMEIIKRRRETNGKSPWVLPSNSSSGHYSDPHYAMLSIRKQTGIKDIRFHDLRRTLGSWMASEYSLQLIGKVLGHRSKQSTAVYARIAEKNAKSAMTKTAAEMDRHVKKKTKK